MGASHGGIFGPAGCLQVQEHSHWGGGHVFPASAIYFNAGCTSCVIESDTIEWLKSVIVVNNFMQYYEMDDRPALSLTRLKWFIERAFINLS